MTRPSYSFIGLVKLTRMDSSEGWTYTTSICYPLQACDKNNEVLTRNSGEKWKWTHPVFCVKATCHSWTRHSVTFMSGLGNSFLLQLIEPHWKYSWFLVLLLSQTLPSQLSCRYVFKRSSTSVQNSFANSSLQSHRPSLSQSLQTIFKTWHCVSCRRLSYDRSLPINFNSLSRKLI